MCFVSALLASIDTALSPYVTSVDLLDQANVRKTRVVEHAPSVKGVAVLQIDQSAALSIGLITKVFCARTQSIAE